MNSYLTLPPEARAVVDVRVRELLAEGTTGPTVYRWLADTLDNAAAVEELCAQDDLTQLMLAACLERVIALTAPTENIGRA